MWRMEVALKKSFKECESGATVDGKLNAKAYLRNQVYFASRDNEHDKYLNNKNVATANLLSDKGFVRQIKLKEDMTKDELANRDIDIQVEFEELARRQALEYNEFVKKATKHSVDRMSVYVRC